MPNPMVGAVLVYNDTIIGEGFHRFYGESHAEVNCLASVKEENKHLIPDSTLFVSLEPCAHTGRTPPCTHLILKHGIKKVVVGCSDPFKQVNGKGIQMLRSAGVEVETGILEKECIALNKRFFTFHTKHRPYIVLKWAQTNDQHVAAENYARLYITNDLANRLVHKWRSEEASILVGTNTALYDDPELTNRLWAGHNPVRLVVDLELKLPATLKLLNGKGRTIIFNTLMHEEKENLLYYQVTHDVNLVHQMVNALYHHNIQSVLVEGGSRLLKTFLDDGLWDEVRVITATEMHTSKGIRSPLLQNIRLHESFELGSNRIDFYHPS
jgi:diaminohydroxyphosphoribosylaminopyrimidine deaminase/5-amino-6-(5-phosphoribosylamino)uracil reductase